MYFKSLYLYEKTAICVSTRIVRKFAVSGGNSPIFLRKIATHHSTSFNEIDNLHSKDFVK